MTWHDGVAEWTGLPNDLYDIVVFAQSWHWVDSERAGLEVERILAPGGVLGIVWNQMDVSIPWVHRLTRIMRSGDVHRPDKPPTPGGGFAPMTLTQVAWEDRMTPEEILTLGTTRSSYIRSSEAGRARMQVNLRWYLYEHLGYAPGSRLRSLHVPRVARSPVRAWPLRESAEGNLFFGLVVEPASASRLFRGRRRSPRDVAAPPAPPGLVPLLKREAAPGTMGTMGLSFLGVIAALAMYAVSVAPSLMARSWAWHAVASGVLVSCGYVGGVIVQNVGARIIAMTGLTIRASEPVEIGFRVCAAVLLRCGGSTPSSSRIAGPASPPDLSTCRARPSASTSWEPQGPSSLHGASSRSWVP